MASRTRTIIAWLVVNALALACACDERRPSAPSSPHITTNTPVPTSTETLVEEPCRIVSRETRWQGDFGARQIALSKDLAWLVLSNGRDAIQIAHEGAMQSLSLSISGGLLGMERVRESPLLLALGNDREGHPTLHAIPLGSTRDAVHSVRLEGRPHTFRRASTDDAVYFAWADRHGHRGVEAFQMQESRWSHTHHSLGDQDADIDFPVEILAFDATTHGWSVLWRRGVSESHGAHVYLSRGTSSIPIEALHEALAIDAFQQTEQRVAIIATFEFSRPHFLSIPNGAADPNQVVTLHPQSEIPAPIEARRRYRLSTDARGLWLHQRSMMGDRTGAPFLISRQRFRSAAITRHQEALTVALLASSGGEQEVQLLGLRCDDSTPE